MHVPRRYVSVSVAVAVSVFYAGLLYWFDSVDFYDRHFFDHGVLVRFYNLARLLFIPYFAWTIYAVGAAATTMIFGRGGFFDLPAWERYPVGFLSGAGIGHVVMFALGSAGLDIKPVAVGLALAVMVLSIPHLAACLRGAADAISLRFQQKENIAPVAMVALALVAVLAAFLLAKGLYPAGGHDYYNHYFQFYKRVVETGSIQPNDVWYQFYYSKGLGLFFLAMLLTDPLAPQLVATAFIGTGAAIVFAFLRRTTSARLLPVIGAVLYILLLIYTPGPHDNMVQGGWGDLEKPHEIMAVMILGLVWIAYRIFDDAVGPLGPWQLALHATIAGVAIVTLPMAVISGAYMAVYVLWFAVWRDGKILRPLAAGVTTALCLLVALAVNYAYTGLALDEAILYLWPITDLRRLAHWGVLFEVVELHRAHTGLLANRVPWSWSTLPLTFKFLRLELLWPLAAGPLLVIAYLLRNAASRERLYRSFNAPAWRALALFAIIVIMAALFGGGRAQPISFYRLSSFSFGPMLCAALLLWHFDFDERCRAKAARSLALTMMMALAGSGYAAAAQRDKVAEICGNLSKIFANARHLWRGEFSLKDAYQNQQGWPGRMPWGGIYPGVETAWRIVSPGTRIWSFHIHSYCMLPDCNLQGFMSFRFSRNWASVYFGTPERAAAVLKSEGLDYFFFSTELRLEDTLPHAPLFSPKVIGQYLAVRWTDGTSYLLTWPGPDTKPIDQHFIDAYAKAAAESSIYRAFPYEQWRNIAGYIDLHRQNLQPFFLPWCTTCDNLPRIEQRQTP